jgi:uncharacterized protein YciI
MPEISHLQDHGFLQLAPIGPFKPTDAKLPEARWEIRFGDLAKAIPVEDLRHDS